MQRGSAIVKERISQESQAEFDRIYRAEQTRVRRHLIYLTGDSSTAEDLTQEAFGRLYDRFLAQDPEPLRNPRAWLLTVASNLAYNHFRAQSRRTARETAAATSATIPAAADSNAGVDDIVDVRQALAQLEPRDRIILMLRHSGFSYAEIAQAVGVAPTSIGTTLARAQRRFKDVYVGRAGAAGKE